jgi:acyl-coenzyme A thioesterase PaaI-like protein
MESANESSTNSALNLGSELLKQSGYAQRSDKWDDYIAHTMDVWFRWDSDIEASFAWYVTPWHLNGARVLHGGATVTFLDHCMGALCYNMTGGKFAHTLQLSTQFLRPVRANRWVMCTATLASGSKQVNQLEAVAWVQDMSRWPSIGNIVAKAHGTFVNPDRRIKP